VICAACKCADCGQAKIVFKYGIGARGFVLPANALIAGEQKLFFNTAFLDDGFAKQNLFFQANIVTCIAV
jgi:hypothetical protein